jgi:Flp pilus assembly pilin Flp
MNFAAISQYLNLRMNRGEKGVTTIEYAVMIVLVAGAVIAFGTSLSSAITGVFSSIAAKL